MTTVYLTEKPSVAKDMADVMGVKARSRFHIETNDGSILVWARGHLLSLVDPADYNDDWGGYWKWDALPMIPDAWKYKVIRGTGDQVKAIASHIKKASLVVVATDAGREGELIGRLILEHCKYKGPVKRFWASEMTPAGIKTALANLRPGEDYEPLLAAAKSRQHADWLYGLNGTRAATLASKVRGDFFPMGRVQTPTLALIVNRDKAIADFKSSAFYELELTVSTDKGEEFTLSHAPNEENRITDKAEADALHAKALSATKTTLSVVKEPGAERPPLPYSLLTLQRDANRKFGLSASDTLKIAQTLYDKKFLSYPRTDCAYLAENQKEQVPAVLDAIKARFPAAVKSLESQGAVLRDSVFDDKKLSDHHALIPTYLTPTGLVGDEEKIYHLVCMRFLRAMGQDVLFDQTKVSTSLNGVEFKAADKVIRSSGWRGILD